MSKSGALPGEQVLSPEGAETIWQRCWSLFQRVMGWGLLVVALAIVGLYFLWVIPAGTEPGTGLLGAVHQVMARVRSGRDSSGVFLLIVALWACSQFMFLKKESEGVRAVLGLVLGGLVFIGLGGHMLSHQTLWGWGLAALPAMLVVHHGLYLGRIKPHFLPEELKAHPEKVGLDRYNLKDLVEASDRYFNASNIALRYGLPALAILAIGAILFHSLNPVTGWALEKVLLEPGGEKVQQWISAPTLEAARYGAAGAYVYVLLYLGQRGFRHDISSGSALWCAVTLGLGPILAAVFSTVWLREASADPTGWATRALYFGVGLSPRHLAQQVTRLVQRVVTDSGKTPAKDRTIPLTVIRGITPQIEERLSEEGIYDAVGMAMADPMRLQRNTNFDKHQILAWIDAALLVHTLPESWESLERKGIRGARDLVWYTYETGPDAESGFKHLASEVLDENLLRDVAWRLAQDAQAQRIQLLYQLVSTQDEFSQKPPSFDVPPGLVLAAPQLQSAVLPLEKAPTAEAGGAGPSLVREDPVTAPGK
ncbi:hypothetical protein POL68_27650 [Stigmatella sp. ncwal1]|uniref:Uncharacterized protein n=1 Tax=Stigmatella ashevillensis TaxID=2995309 RepID=A0ABT5DGP3_9BACT|nr:hypothetical protein [Stigmatella ashevillena]MDC0712273.1 hypothetical protein [Stigmatella ashevillena]